MWLLVEGMGLRCSMVHGMDVTTTALSAAIGARVRQERQARRWTLDALAEAAGVSRRMLVNVEQGATNPSVGILLRISQALGIGLPALVENPQVAAVKVTRRGEGSILWRGDRGGVGVLLSGTESPDVLELWDWTLQPGERHESEEHATGTKELLQVLDGDIEVTVGEQTHPLATGDVIAFSGDAPHAYANPGTAPARFTLSVFEPGVGSPKASETHGD